MKQLLSIIAFVSLLTSCSKSKNENLVSDNDAIYGKWQAWAMYTDSPYEIEFKADGKYIHSYAVGALDSNGNLPTFQGSYTYKSNILNTKSETRVIVDGTQVDYKVFDTTRDCVITGSKMTLGKTKVYNRIN